MSNTKADAPPTLSLGPFFALVVCAILWPSVLTFDPGDWPSPHQYPLNATTMNACGAVGAWCSYHLLRVIGDGTYPLLLFATLLSLMRLTRGEVGRLGQRIGGLALLILCTSATSHLVAAPESALLPEGSGGLIGFALGDLMTRHLSRLGTLIIIASSFLVGLVFVTEGWVLTLPAVLKRHGLSGLAAATLLRRWVSARTVRRPVTVDGGVSPSEQNALLGRQKAQAEDEYEYVEEEAEDDTVYYYEEEETEEPEPASPAARRKRSKKAESAKSTGSKTTGASSRSIKAPPGPIVRFSQADKAAASEPYPREIENWRLPSLNLLREPEYSFTKQQEGVVREQAQVLDRTLEEFRLDARVVEIDTGPVITMFELKLGAGIKVSQIAVLSNDIARALKAHAIRVVAPITGKNTVGIEVPNVNKEQVRLKELMQLAGKPASEMGLPLFLGKDAGGAALVADLTKMPHILIAGTTGSGKSVCLNSVILSFLMMKRPDHVKLILIDPKMVEMSQFKNIPHLMCPIVTDMGQAEKILEWAVTKMDERYELLAEARVRNIASFNALGAEEVYARLQPSGAEEKARIATHLPFIVIVIDELADLMMTSAKEVEHHLSRLAQKSRAVGVHIIVATQRPEAKVVTGLIKSNLPSRICFRVASRMDSRIVLDQNGGEVLLGQGDMLFLPPGSHKLTRAQGTYVGDDEMHAVLNDLTERADPEFHPELVAIGRASSRDGIDMRDPMFDRAVVVVLESKRGSVSLLQRRLTIGYSRASRLIEQMADAGIVGNYKGSQAREVNMTVEQWKALQAQRDEEEAREAEEAVDDCETQDQTQTIGAPGDW